MLAGRTSSLSDREPLTRLLKEALNLTDDAVSISASFQKWKYWDAHPHVEGSRSHILESDGNIAAHGCIWPVPLRTPFGPLPAFHLIDWAARTDVPGVGMQVLRRCCGDMAAAFSIGGTAITRKILPAFGYRPQNTMTFFQRPLRLFQPALRESALDWKMPARVGRNLAWSLFPHVPLAPGWGLSPLDVKEIPESLWPEASADQAVSLRSSQLLEHVQRCPLVRQSACFSLRKGTQPVAYLFLVQVGDQVRLADYGPANLDEETASILGVAAQKAARSSFPSATTAVAATSEPSVRAGFLRSGFRISREEEIRALKLNKILNPIKQFRLTLLDWDALCL